MLEVIWQNRRHIAAADGWFNGIHQVAAICPPVSPHWRQLVNTIEIVLHSSHRSPQPKRQINRFSRFCKAHDRSPYGRPPIRKIASSHWGSGRIYIHSTAMRPITRNLINTNWNILRKAQLVANVIAALLTYQLPTMLVEVSDPVSRYFIWMTYFCGLITSSGHDHLNRHMALSMGDRL